MRAPLADALRALQYDEANKEVAILCNHQKGVSKNHDTAMAKLMEKKEAMQAELRGASGAAAGRIRYARCASCARVAAHARG